MSLATAIDAAAAAAEGTTSQRSPELAPSLGQRNKRQSWRSCHSVVERGRVEGGRFLTQQCLLSSSVCGAKLTMATTPSH